MTSLTRRSILAGSALAAAATLSRPASAAAGGSLRLEGRREGS